MKVIRAQIAVSDALEALELQGVSNINPRPMADRDMERKFKQTNHGRKTGNWKGHRGTQYRVSF